VFRLTEMPPAATDEAADTDAADLAGIGGGA
jgi:hypothetical protein